MSTAKNDDKFYKVRYHHGKWWCDLYNGAEYESSVGGYRFIENCEAHGLTLGLESEEAREQRYYDEADHLNDDEAKKKFIAESKAVAK